MNKETDNPQGADTPVGINIELRSSGFVERRWEGLWQWLLAGDRDEAAEAGVEDNATPQPKDKPEPRESHGGIADA